MELWEALSNRRKEIGMSFDDLQSKTNLSISTIKKILGGHVAAPSFDSVRTIAYAMDITMAELDRRIADSGKNESADSPYSPEALELAAIFDKLDPHSKRVVESVVRLESERTAQSLPKGIMAISDMPTKPIPYLGTLNCTGTIETKQAAKQELLELESEEENTPVDL